MYLVHLPCLSLCFVRGCFGEVWKGTARGETAALKIPYGRDLQKTTQEAKILEYVLFVFIMNYYFGFILIYLFIHFHIRIRLRIRIRIGF